MLPSLYTSCFRYSLKSSICCSLGNPVSISVLMALSRLSGCFSFWKSAFHKPCPFSCGNNEASSLLPLKKDVYCVTDSASVTVSAPCSICSNAEVAKAAITQIIKETAQILVNTDGFCIFIIAVIRSSILFVPKLFPNGTKTLFISSIWIKERA